MVNSSINLSVLISDEKKKSLTLGFSSKSHPDILVNGSPSTDDYGPAEASVKSISTIRSTLRYDQHVELLRNDLIPKEWNTNNRVSCSKPELTEVTIESWNCYLVFLIHSRHSIFRLQNLSFLFSLCAYYWTIKCVCTYLYNLIMSNTIEKTLFSHHFICMGYCFKLDRE